MEQFDQLLTCCVCLDRYRNPKLLPCQHSYCMEPCMEGLVDYVKRQVKCPECRAEHRIPYNGIQGFPTNFTLQKFLELHAEITGELPDPNADAIMSRCNVCSEKAYVNPCAHCDKKVCDDCKEAHCDILKREIARVNNQVKRGFHRIEECVQQVDRNQQQLQQNGNSVIAEIEEIHRRLSLALKERTDYLKNSVEKYLTTEVKNLKELKSNLDLELANIQSNSDLMEKHMSEDSCKWDDNELMDCKDIFIKMMDFIRNYDPGNEEYSRRIRFTCHDSVNEIARKILEIGELKINDPKPKETEDADIPIRSTGLARSKSDHRLVAEFRRREEGGSPPRRRFGESRYSREDNKSRTNFGRYNADDDDDGDSALRGGRFRSRFLRPDDDDESGNRKSLHIDDDDESRRPMKKERIKVVDTEDASRGPLSGTIRLADSSRIIQRLKEWEMFKLKPKKKEEPAPVYKFVPLKPNPALAMGAIAPQPTPKEDDEIDKIKKENKEVTTPASTATVTTTATASAATTAASRYTTTPIRPPATVATPAPAAQVAPATTLTKQESQESTSSSSEEEKKDEPEEEGDSDEYEYYDYDEDEEEEATPAATTASKATTTTTTTTSKASSTLPALTSVTNTAASRSAALAQDTSAPERKYSYDYTSPFSSRTTTTATTNQSQPSSYGSTYASMRSSASTAPTPPSPTVAPVVAPVPAPTPPTPAVTTPAPSVTPQDSKQSSRYLGSRTMPNIGNVLNSSQDTEDESSSATAIAEAARNSVTARYRRIRDDSDSFVNKYLAQSRGTSQEAGAKTSASMSAVSSAGPSNAPSTSSTTTPLATRKISDESQYPSGRSRYAALKERKSRVARSKSSAVLGMDASPDDDEEDGDDANEPTPFTSRFGRELAKSRSSHFLKSEDASNSTTEDDNLSSWARYLKNKYGGRKKNTDNDNATTQNENNLNANNNNNRNANTNSNLIVSYSGPRGQYLQKQSLLMTFGSRGSQPGLFTWPRGIAVGPDNSIVVADSSNHRVQIFNEVGQHRFSFGCYGNGDGEFDCLAGVAVNRIGQYIIADRYNHRIQIFDPSGHFLRAFGSQGTTDGKFSYPWGITTDALGFIYVCDKENHRIQVFQSDGTFVGKFGTMGSKPGQLEHPHYIAVSNTNRVIVSDSNNHRIQIFDVNGKVLTMFGSEGTDEGQFKFPRGVAVDEQGYIFVADSGNNRIQIFNPDGTFLRGFGRWGQGEGEFKGLEGIAVNSKGNILVADRENHRVQMF